MDSGIIWSLVTFVVLGVLSYSAFKLLRFMNDTRPMSELDNPETLTSWRKKSRKGKTGTKVSIERVTKCATDSETPFSTENTVLEVPSRHRMEEESVDLTKERGIQDDSDNFTISDNETEGEDEESDQNEDYKAFMAVVNEEELNKYIDELGVLRGLIKYINENLHAWMARKLKIAIIGNSGTGKSSLINAIMDLKPEDKRAAQVGVTETTFGKQEYVLPSNENISLSDLPGVGTQNFKKENYLEAVNLKEFDVFLIVSASRFTENDIWLAKQILQYQSFVIFLRTKIDFDLTNEKSDHPSTYNEASCLQKIRMDIVKNLRTADFPHKRSGIFLVSSRQSKKFDFPDLLKSLNRILSKKRFALSKVLESHLQETLFRRKKEAECLYFIEKIRVFYLRFGVGVLLLHMIKARKRYFSLEDNTLEMISKEIDMTLTRIKRKELKYFKFEEMLVKEKIRQYKEFYNRFYAACGVMARDEAKLISLRLQYLEKQLQPL